MQPMVGIQLSVFGKTLRERFLQMTGWILQPCSVRSQVPRFQCLLVDGHTPEWCEGDALIPLGDCWTPVLGRTRPRTAAQARVRRGGFCRPACRRSII